MFALIGKDCRIRLILALLLAAALVALLPGYQPPGAAVGFEGLRPSGAATFEGLGLSGAGAFEGLSLSGAEIQGDADCSQDVDSVDALHVLRFVVGQPAAACIHLADVDCDGDRDAVDSLRILRHVAGLAGNAGAGCAAIGEALGVSVQPVSPPFAGLGVPFEYGLSASGGEPPYTWTVSEGALPPGIELLNVTPTDAEGDPAGDQFGLLQGTPTEEGSFEFTAQVTDAGGDSALVSIEIAVLGPGFETGGICAAPTACLAKHTVAIDSGDGQDGLIGYPLPQPLKVKVNPAEAGVGVAWRIDAGGGQIRKWTTTTDANGIAWVEYILGKTAGTNKITATLLEGDLSDPSKAPPSVTFEVEGKKPTLEKLNDGQTVQAASAFGKPIAVTVKDPDGNPVQGVKVVFKTGGAGGLMVMPSEGLTAPVKGTFTDASGIARAVAGFPRQEAGGPGAKNVTAELPEFGVSTEFTLTVTDASNVLLTSQLETLVPGGSTSIQIFVLKPRPAEEQPPLCYSVPVSVSVAEGDGTPGAATVNTSPADCTAAVTYTFGKDPDPDIVKLEADGKTVYYAIAPPNIEVQAIDFLNSVDIRKNQAADVEASPEWRKEYKASDRNEPAAYAINTSVTIKATLLADGFVSKADIEASVIDGGALGTVVKKADVALGGSAVQVEFTVDGKTAAAIAKGDVRWQWKFSDMDDKGGATKNTTASGLHTIYTLLTATPQAPMSEPWTEVLDHSTSSSWAGGAATAADAATGVAKKTFASIGLVYDTASGAPLAGQPPLFHLTTFLGHLRDGGVKVCNCYDAAHVVVTFGNAVGAGMNARYMDGGVGVGVTAGGTVVTWERNINQPLNIIDPIGEEAPITNNTFAPAEPLIHDDTRTGGFGNHMYAVIGTNVYDANLMVDIERAPEGGAGEFPAAAPFSLELPTGMDEGVYKDRLLDDAPVHGGPMNGPATIVDVPFTVD